MAFTEQDENWFRPERAAELVPAMASQASFEGALAGSVELARQWPTREDPAHTVGVILPSNTPKQEVLFNAGSGIAPTAN